jgi:hypothetical protein
MVKSENPISDIRIFCYDRVHDNPIVLRLHPFRSGSHWNASAMMVKSANPISDIRIICYVGSAPLMPASGANRGGDIEGDGGNFKADDRATI